MSQPTAATKPRGPLYRWFERLVLGFAMSLVVLVVERRILKALKMGGGIETSREAQLSTAKQINHETHR